MKLVDTNKDAERLVQTYHHGTYTVRVEVRRDSYQRQSYAIAQVLSTALTWTTIADTPASQWHGTRAPLTDVAEGLARRAEKILVVTTN